MNTHVIKALQPYTPDVDTLVTRFGFRITASLTEHSRSLPHDVSERLRFAREQALATAKSGRAVGALAVARAETVEQVQNGSTLAFKSQGSPNDRSSQGWLKFASFLPLLVLVTGILLIQHEQWDQQVNAAAEIDTALLSDSVPPAAYGDPGFSEFLIDDQP